jgi:predicted TIM-barrel fold metal-dependent hydrolase
MNPEYGRRDAEIFLSQVLPKAPDVPIQIAHLAGWGGYGAETDAALSVFAEAFASGDRRVTNVYFDLSGLTGVSPSTAERVVQQIRRIGIDRMLFGIDRVGTPGQAWESLTRFPFTRDELARIATNLAPWLRPQADR